MKKLFFALLLVLFSASALADPLNEAIVQRIEKSDTLRGEFSQQKQLAILPQPIKSSGSFIYQRQLGLLWQIQSPLQSRTLFDQQGIHNLNQHDTTPQSRTAQGAMQLFSQLFFALISTDLSQLAQHFEISGENRPEAWRLTLTPKPGDVNKVIKTLQLQGDRQLQQVIFTDINGDQTTIEFHNQSSTQLNREEKQRFAR